jgi:HEPN domain-containing protein
MTNEQLVKYWEESSDDDFEAVLALYNNRKYSQSLYYGHLVIERLFKALYAKLNPKTPYAIKTHNLLLLADKCDLKLNDERIKLEMINRFNLDARYEDYKREFSRMCTYEFTAEQIKSIKEIRTWLKELIAK